MTILPALHGRARMRRAGLVRLLLFALLLLVPIGLRALEVEVFRFVRFAGRGAAFDTFATWVYALEEIILVAGYLFSGAAIDRLGFKRTFALVLLAWSALVVLGATVLDPIAYRILSPLLTVLLPCFVLTGVLGAVRLAWPPRRRGLVVAAMVIAYDLVLKRGLFIASFPPPDHALPETWHYPMLALVTCGAELLAVWVFGCPEVDPASGLDLRPVPCRRVWRAILADRSVWVILVIQLSQMLILQESLKLRWDFQNTSTAGAFTLGLAVHVAFLSAAWGSDRLYRWRRDWVAARRSILIAGFVVVAIAPLIAILSSQNGPALQLIDLVAIGALRIDDLLTVDCAPRRFAGRYIGLLLAGESAGSLYLFPLIRKLEIGSFGIVAVICVAALVGGALSVWVLPKLRPAG